MTAATAVAVLREDLQGTAAAVKALRSGGDAEAATSALDRAVARVRAAAAAAEEADVAACVAAMDEFYAAQQTAGRSCAITNARIAVAYAELVPASEDPVVLLTKLARRADKVLAEDRDRVVATFSTPRSRTACTS